MRPGAQARRFPRAPRARHHERIISGSAYETVFFKQIQKEPVPRAHHLDHLRLCPLFPSLKRRRAEPWPDPSAAALGVARPRRVCRRPDLRARGHHPSSLLPPRLSLVDLRPLRFHRHDRPVLQRHHPLFHRRPAHADLRHAPHGHGHRQGRFRYRHENARLSDRHGALFPAARLHPARVFSSRTSAISRSSP